MKIVTTVKNDRRQMPQSGTSESLVARRSSLAASGFSMVELLVTMTLLTLIVFALMAVFSSTQRAFRASVTQTDVLEGSRAAMDMMAMDLRNMVPSDEVSNFVSVGNNNYYYGTVNLFVTNNSYAYTPLIQPLPASIAQRTNLLQYFFVIGRVNTRWTGAGYIVNNASTKPLYPLYRYYAETNITASPVTLYWNFLNLIYNAQWTNMSHVMDGVTHLVVRAYDTTGYQMTNTYQFRGSQWATNANVWFSPAYPGGPQSLGEVGFAFYSNAVPATVELQMGVLEDRTLQRAESLDNGNSPGPLSANNPPQWLYLQQQSGHVHVFRQRIMIPNLDPSAYQ